MTLIRLENLAPGMVLNSDVCDRRGRVLLPAGAELTEKHLRIFLTWGISDADIISEEGVEAPPAFADDLDPELLARATAEVERHFTHCDPGHPVIKELKHICILRKVSHAP